MTKKILIINGPNLNLLGEREESKYGKVTLEEVKRNCETHAKSIDLEIKSIFKRLDQIPNCSTAAALYVSAATKVTFLLLSFKYLASFAELVVFPEPLTPIIIIIFFSLSALLSTSLIEFFIKRLTPI